MTIIQLAEVFAIHRLPSDAVISKTLLNQKWVFIARTDDELSIVCPENLFSSSTCESPWRAFKVQGPLNFSELGILSELATVLAESEISIFCVSTFDTDYILVRAEKFQRAALALVEAGHAVRQSKV